MLLVEAACWDCYAPKVLAPIIERRFSKLIWLIRRLRLENAAARHTRIIPPHRFVVSMPTLNSHRGWHASSYSVPSGTPLP